jgi:hypothetical protein
MDKVGYSYLENESISKITLCHNCKRWMEHSAKVNTKANDIGCYLPVRDRQSTGVWGGLAKDWMNG